MISLTRRNSIIVGLCVLLLAMGYAAGSWAESRIRSEALQVFYRSDLSVLVDGKATDLDIAPFIVSPGWIVAPIESLARELGHRCEWDDATSTFEIFSTYPPPEPEPEVFRVGQTATRGDWEVSVRGVRLTTSAQFDPSSGRRLLALDIKIRNVGERAGSVSSVLMFDLVDREDGVHDRFMFAGQGGGLDGSLGPGLAIRGEIVWVVRPASFTWYLLFTPPMTEGEQAIFQVSLTDMLPD